MGISDLRQHLADVPGIQGLTMRYEDGGRVQVYTIDGVYEGRVGPNASNDDIKAALLKALADAE